MNKKLTVIMPYLNEPDNDVYKTIKNIYETVNPNNVEIIAIDDCSTREFIANLKEFPAVRHIRNKERIGVDGCRQIGIDLTNTEALCLLDSHMRFSNKWIDIMVDCIEKEPSTVWCTSCMQLGYGNMNLSRSNIEYTGASLLLVDKNAIKDRPAREVLEPKWLPKKEEMEYEIPCVLGANYFLTKKWADHIQGLKGLKMWGTSEPFLSLKTWLAGGKCKITRKVKIGHKFRDVAPYTTQVWTMVYNKIYLCKTVLSHDLGEKLIGFLPKDNNFKIAMAEISKNKEKIDKERQYYNDIFKIDIKDFCSKFEIQLP